VDIVAIIVLVVAGAYMWRLADWHWFGVSCVTIALLFSLMLIAAFVVIPPLVFRREPKFRDHYSLTFSENGIHFRTVHIDSQLQWSLYSHARVEADSYVLYYGSRQFTLIPKRVFQDSEQRQAFELLLTQHVSPIVRRDV
jgi:hypothetical protein